MTDKQAFYEGRRARQILTILGFVAWFVIIQWMCLAANAQLSPEPSSLSKLNTRGQVCRRDGAITTCEHARLYFLKLAVPRGPVPKAWKIDFSAGETKWLRLHPARCKSLDDGWWLCDDVSFEARGDLR